MQFGPQQWITWIGTLLGAATMVISFAFTTFQTRSEADARRAELVARFDRMEGKLDRIIENHIVKLERKAKARVFERPRQVADKSRSDAQPIAAHPGKEKPEPASVIDWEPWPSSDHMKVSYRN